MAYAGPYIPYGSDLTNVNPNQTYFAQLIRGGLSYTTTQKKPNCPIQLMGYPPTLLAQTYPFSGGDASTKATATVKVTATGSQAPAVGHKIAVGLNVKINGFPTIVWGLYTVQSGDTTVSAVATGITTTWKHIADSGTALPTGGKWFCKDLTASESQIRTAVNEIIAAAADVVASSATVTFTAAAVGTSYNSCIMTTRCGPSLPVPVPTFTDGVCDNIYSLEPLGSAAALNQAAGSSLIDLINDQSLQTAARFQGRSNPSYTLTLHELAENDFLYTEMDPNFQWTHDGTAEYASTDGSVVPTPVHGLLLTQSGTKTTLPDWVMVPRANFTIADIPGATAAIKAIQITIAPQLVTGAPILRCKNKYYSALS